MKRIESVVPNSAQYDVVHEEIPRMGRRAAGRVLRHLMKSYIPEKPDAYAMDYRLQPSENGLRATLIIIRKDVLASIRQRYPDAPLRIPAGEGGEPDNLYFQSNRNNASFVVAGGAFLTVLPFAAFFAWTAAEKNAAFESVSAASADSMQSETAEIARLEDKRDALSREWNALVAARPVECASFFDVLAQEAPAVEIKILTVEDRVFDVRGYSADPVSLLKTLSESPFFSEVEVTDIRPLSDASRSEFTLRGIYHGP